MMTEKEQAIKKKLEGIFQELSQGINQVYAENIKLLDQQILTLSAGTLGLSIAFLSNLVDLQSAMWLPLLVFSWVLLSLAVMAVLFGLRYATSLKTIQKSLDAAQQLTGTGDYSEEGPEIASAMEKAFEKNKQIDRHNFLSFWLFICGLSALIIFISINLLCRQP